MFFGCSSLEKLNISFFNFKKVKYIAKMFVGCSDELKNEIMNKYKYLTYNAFN